MIKEVFHAGKWTDAAGKERDWTVSDIDAIVANFQNEKSVNIEGYKVPLFLAHPEKESEAPALGWVKRLWREGKSLFAEFMDLSQKTAEAIMEKSFRDVSISVYKNILQHIGLTNTPAVPGLADFQYTAPHADSETWIFKKKCDDEDEEFAEEGTTIQSLVFDKAKFPTSASVRKWIAEHKDFKV